MPRKQKAKLTFTLEAIVQDGEFSNPIVEIRFSSAARAEKIGNALVYQSIQMLRKYADHRWEDWENAEERLAAAD